MKAIVQSAYGVPKDVLHLAEVPIPVAGPGQVLVRVAFASVHADVWHVVRGWPWVLRAMGSGLLKPVMRVPGTDFSGQVIAVGAGVKRFKPGDLVFGESLVGMQWRNGGTFAEYALAPAENLALKPDGVSLEQAATVATAGLIALNNLSFQGGVQPGQHVLINGAAGGVGSFALQIARAGGATVTAVDHTEKLDLLRKLGADRVVDYTCENFLEEGKRYDLILDVASTLSFLRCRSVMQPRGKYVLIGHDHYGGANGRVLGSVPRALGLGILALLFPQLPKITSTLPPKEAGMETLRRLLAEGRLSPVIGQIFQLNDVVPAMEALQSGRVRGRIVLQIQENEDQTGRG